MNLPFDVAAKTYHRLSKLPLGSIRATGWLREQLLRNKEGMGGNLDRLEPDMIATPFLNYSSFRSLPFMDEVDPTFAAGWSGEISGTYWTGLIQLAFALDDAELKTKAETWVNGVLAHQEADGYLGSFPAHTDRMADYNPWASTWCYRALLACYEATGRTEILSAVSRGLLWFCRHWKDHKTAYAGSTILEPMAVVYAYTGNGALLEFCTDWLSWLEDNSPWQNKVSSLLSDDLPYNSMHAVAYGESVKNPLIVSCVNGDETFRTASLNGMEKALKKIVMNTGAPSSCTEFLSPKGASAETEYCNFATYNHRYMWAAMATGESRWGDELERTVFNGAQGARKKDEKAIAYFSSPNQLYANRESSLYGQLAEYGVYAPCYNVACCPAQSVRILPEFVRSMVLRNRENELYFYLYAPAEIKTADLELEIETLYPFREEIVFRIRKGSMARPHFRIPSWCKKPELRKNGVSVFFATEDGYSVLDGVISEGDVLTLILPQQVEVLRVDDSDFAAKYPVSIVRGPLVYSLPVPTRWSSYEGRPITPLPEEWSWFEARPDLRGVKSPPNSVRVFHAPWQTAVDETLTARRIRAEERDCDGYVWENPPIVLKVPLLHAKYTYVDDTPRTHEVFGATLDTEGEEDYVSMVPYGCTNLRITYLPRATPKK